LFAAFVAAKLPVRLRPFAVFHLQASSKREHITNNDGFFPEHIIDNDGVGQINSLNGDDDG
jgi:hypothetical protein